MALVLDRFTFIHVPRTGGTFVRAVLKAAGLKGVEVGAPTRREAIHAGIADIPPDYKSGTVFGFVRAPEQWLRSRWQHEKGRPIGGWFGECWAPTFVEFAEHVLAKYPEVPTTEMLGRFEPDGHRAMIGQTELLRVHLAGFLKGFGEGKAAHIATHHPLVNVSVGRITIPTDLTRRVRLANARFCRMFGYPLEGGTVAR